VDWTLVPIFLAIGGVVGFIAGLLGIGGGMTMIPLLTLIFSYQRFPPSTSCHCGGDIAGDDRVHLDFQRRTHHAHDAVVWPIFWKLAPGILAGSLLGPAVSGLSTAALSGCSPRSRRSPATRLLRNPKPRRPCAAGRASMFAVGSAIGVLSSMVGAGGAFVSVPFMTACNVRIHAWSRLRRRSACRSRRRTPSAI
jgi:uncharacterized membrane protein YfcA